MDTILGTVKRHLGGEMVANVFDDDIITAINTTIGILHQAGVKVILFSITDATEWEEVFPNIHQVEMIKSYINAKVKLYFDPPSSGTLTDLSKELLDELLWRINAEEDPLWKE